MVVDANGAFGGGRPSLRYGCVLSTASSCSSSSKSWEDDDHKGIGNVDALHRSHGHDSCHERR